jgi:uncharacterized membrane protein
VIRLKFPNSSQPKNPALLQQQQDRARAFENRLADTITRFAGSMRFVYIHLIWFALWIILQVEHYPFGLLTMIVSLESIFLSTFLLISQNRSDERRQVLADQQWESVQASQQQQDEVLRLSQRILERTEAVHTLASARSAVTAP